MDTAPGLSLEKSKASAMIQFRLRVLLVCTETVQSQNMLGEPSRTNQFVAGGLEVEVKTLGNQNDKNEILGRLQKINASCERRWGKMTPHQMICHLDDSFKSVIGERKVRRP